MTQILQTNRTTFLLFFFLMFFGWIDVHLCAFLLVGEEKKMIEWAKIKYLVFSAGSVKGYAYLGALQALRPLWVLQRPCSKVRGVAGSSIGALFSLFLVLGYTIPEMETNLSEFDWSSHVVRELSWFNLLQDFGMNNMSTIEKTIEQFFTRKKVSPQITFSQLFSMSNIDLKICVTNVTLSIEEIHDHKSRPNGSVLESLIASMSIPILFSPKKMNGHLYSDGGLKNHFPLEVFPVAETVGFQLEEDLSTEITGLSDYLYHIFYSATHQQQKQGNVVNIKIKNVSICDFNLPFHRKDEIVKIGKVTTQKFIEDNVIEWKLWSLLQQILGSKTTRDEQK
jgi:predicted acylesterase/phospholipase RssA